MSSTLRYGPKPQERQKGPGGRLLCRCGCGREPQGRRTSYVDDGCAQIFQERWFPAVQHARVLERDNGICAMCGMDCIAARKRISELRPRSYSEQKSPEYLALLKRCGVECGMGSRHRLYDIDHIVPVVEGGADGGIDNLRTLCIPCHRNETAALRKRIAGRQR